MLKGIPNFLWDALPRMAGTMFHEGGAVNVGFPTVLTPVRLQSRVNPLVANELCALAKSSVTLVTLKGLYLGVGPLMLSQVFPAAEALLTCLTRKAFLNQPRMPPGTWVPSQGCPAFVESLSVSGVTVLVANEG